MLTSSAFATKPGDLDSDGLITITDLMIGLRAISDITNDININADVNNDDIIGLEEIIYIFKICANGEPLNSFPTQLEGYVWLIGASFINSEYTNTSTRNGKRTNTISTSYAFALSITPEKVFCTTIPGFDPTKGILRQNISKPGEIPGAKRPTAFLSLVIPQNTRFNFIKSTNGDVTLISEPIIIPADDPKNPARRELKRTWTIKIFNEAFLSGHIDHGTITEETEGFIPGSKKILSEGTLYIAPFQPVNMATIK